MAVKLRMTRIGRRHRPFFRINAVESRVPRDGKILEKLGHYDPIEKDKDKQIVLNAERVRYWLDNGAVPSDTVSQILLRKGIKHKYAEETKARREKAKSIAHAKGKLFDKTERLAAQKAVEAEQTKAKAKEEAKAKAEAEAKAKAEAKAQADEKSKAEAVETEAKVDEPVVKTEPEAKTEASEPENQTKDETGTEEGSVSEEKPEKENEN